MYTAIEDDPRLSQGDIVSNVVFAYIPAIADPAFILNDDYVEKDLTLPFEVDEELTVICQAHKSTVLVLAPSCNIDHDDYISVARIFPLNDPDYNKIPETRGARRARHLDRAYQRVGINPSVYYLQESPETDFPKSLVSLVELHTIRNTDENLAYLAQNRILRLNSEALGDLQYRIGFFFGRYATTGPYMLTDAERALMIPTHNATDP